MKRAFRKARNKEENGKKNRARSTSPLFLAEHLRNALSFGCHAKEKNKELNTISWNVFLKTSTWFALHLWWLVFLQRSQHPTRSPVWESKVYWSLSLCSTELQRIFSCTLAAFNLPRLFNNSVLLQHKRQARNLRPQFSALDRTWHYTLTVFDNLACSLEAIRLHND